MQISIQFDEFVYQKIQIPILTRFSPKLVGPCFSPILKIIFRSNIRTFRLSTISKANLSWRSCLTVNFCWFCCFLRFTTFVNPFHSFSKNFTTFLRSSKMSVDFKSQLVDIQGAQLIFKARPRFSESWDWEYRLSQFWKTEK